jgi:hypothetical protein
VPKPKQKQKHRARVVDTDDMPSEGDSNGISHIPSDDEYIFESGGNSDASIRDKPFFTIQIAGNMADSGATVNILNNRDYRSLSPKPDLIPSKTKIYPYMSRSPLILSGKFEAELRNGDNVCQETIYVVQGHSSSVISWRTSQQLNLIKAANAVNHQKSPDFLSEFPNVTNGLGAYIGDPVRVHVNHDIKPVAQPHRRIPFHVRKKVEEKLMQLKDADIIERSEGPTPWVSPIVVVPKPRNPQDIRICVDMRSANRAIVRERHIIPTIDDIAVDLNGCKMFSKLDLTQGYHQILLHPDSRYITTFSTHIGLWQYKRLNFGMSCSAEIFQRIISDVIAGIPGTRNISDDIYVGGKDITEHDERLRLVLKRLSEYNLTVNVPKCEFRVPSILFFGHKFSAEGISPDPKKVENLKSIKPPTNVSEVRSLLSSASFCSKFIRNFATITKPLRRLTCKDVKWTWGQTEQSALEKLKAALSEKTTLSYFDPEKDTTLFVDGSPVGLGGILTQSDGNEVNPLYYASRPLIDTETRYPQIDREALSIYWAVKRFHLFVYGKEFRVITDHMPLVSIFNNPTSRASARIERWLMELQQYRFTVEYQPGHNNPADYASRHPLPENEDNDQYADQYVAYIAQNAVPMLQAVMLSLKSGQWHKPPPGVSIAELSRFERIKTELTCTNTLLLKSNRIVVPTSLQERAIDIAHEAHLGIAKTKGLVREKVWFPLMDKMIEQKVRSCLPCQIATPVTSREPLQMTTLPQGPFQEVSVDFVRKVKMYFY